MCCMSLTQSSQAIIELSSSTGKNTFIILMNLVDHRNGFSLNHYPKSMTHIMQNFRAPRTENEVMFNRSFYRKTLN